ncbi:hypothetical protein TEA_005514 [Camellia sinensis var. sinensis]|uniref:Tim10-like domain-containing protein n=1 Tax=Camellia sinensis var. sinensis TaxID=542762 RepID=A0A4S4E619_CAMSN|nr:hypothetical protein TEA_005514 [Camellia sinensis var. sinensis]
MDSKSIGAQGTYGQVASSSHFDRMVIVALLLCPVIQAIGKAASYKLRGKACNVPRVVQVPTQRSSMWGYGDDDVTPVGLTVRGKCFEKCITKPGSSLSGSESSCTSRCVDRYIEATGIISRALFIINKVGELSKSAKTSSKALWSCLKVWENSKNILKPFAVNDRGNGHLLIGKKKMILLDCIADLSSKT